MRKIALVTGCSTGIGAAIVTKLISTNVKVIATYNNRVPENKHCDVIYKKVDITNQDECLILLDELKKSNLMPDILINNAGIIRDSMFHRMSYEDWNQVLNVNLFSLFNLTQPVFDSMRSKGYGRIVSISSVNANKGQAGQVNYCAAKAGIQGFTKALALEGARFGITVNAISPGYTETNMIKTIRSDILNNIIEKIPLQRLCQPNEVASLVSFLTSEDAGYITGANYEINGGLYFS